MYRRKLIDSLTTREYQRRENFTKLKSETQWIDTNVRYILEAIAWVFKWVAPRDRDVGADAGLIQLPVTVN